MATKKPVAAPETDALHNERVLDRSEARTPRQPAAPIKADSAAEFLRDAFDKRNFGDALPTYKKTVYGPDSLLDDGELKKRIEQYGLEEIAEAMRIAVLRKGEKAIANPLMRKAMKSAIAKFGAEQVAEAFSERILAIPSQEIEIEADRDDELLGKPLEEAVRAYGRVGFAPKFLSENCIKVLGMRGYQVVQDKNGDPVKVGTLIMAEIPQVKADARREHWAELSRAELSTQAEAFEDATERHLAEAGKAGEGLSALRAGETVHADMAGLDELVGQERAGGVRIDRF